LGFRVFNAGRRGYYKANSKWNNALRERLEEKSKGPKHKHSLRDGDDPKEDQKRSEDTQSKGGGGIEGLSSSVYR